MKSLRIIFIITSFLAWQKVSLYENVVMVRVLRHPPKFNPVGIRELILNIQTVSKLISEKCYKKPLIKVSQVVVALSQNIGNNRSSAILLHHETT